MPAHQFEFDLRIDAAESAGTLADAVAVEVVRQLGYAGAAASLIVGEINVAVAELCRKGEACHVRFRAADGELEVLVSAGSHPTRRFLHRIP